MNKVNPRGYPDGQVWLWWALTMSEHTYKMIELVGSSHTSIEAAVQNAIAKAEINESKMRWFEVMETRGHC